MPAPIISEPVALPPARGSLVIELRDLRSAQALPASYVTIERGQAKFEPDYAPSRASPTAFSTFESVPAGTYVVRARRLGYDSRDTTVVVRPTRTDTVQFRIWKLDEVPTGASKRWWQFWR